MAKRKRSDAEQKKDKVTNTAINGVATDIYKTILKEEKPDLAMPVRSLANVNYNQKEGFFKIGRG